MTPEDLAAIVSAVKDGSFVAALLFAFRKIDAGQWVRGVDLKDCQKENKRLHRALERRGISVAPDDDDDDAMVNGGMHV